MNTGIDLVAGDWYAENTGEGLLGTSCLIAFTERGKLFAEDALDNLRPFEYRMILKENAFIERSIQKSPNREIFFDNISDYTCWDRIEGLYPPKYKFKRFLVKIGLYDIIKKMIG